MAMTFPYCNIDDDLQSVYKDIERFRGLDTLTTFTLTSGQSSTYEKRNTGHVGMAYQNGSALTEKTSIATVEATASTWWWDNTNDILYVHMDDGNDPDTADTITVHSIDTWKNFKQKCADRAHQELEAMLDSEYPRPIPFARNSYESINYDSHIVECAALLTCCNIIKSRDSSHPDYKKLYNMVWNDDPDNPGIMNRYKAGDWAFSFEATKDQFDGNIKQLVKDTSSSGYISLRGRGDRSSYERVIILVTTGGLPGAMKWKFSTDYETTWTAIITSTADQQYYHLVNDIYVRFEGTFVANDKWQLDIIGDEHISNPKIGSAIIRVNK